MTEINFLKQFLSHWKELTIKNLEKREVGEVVCDIGGEYKTTNHPLDCRAIGGEPVAFFHNHPSKYTGVEWGEPKLSYGDIGWAIEQIRRMASK